MSIEREIRFVTAGNSNTTSQVFYNNYLADSTPVETDYFSFYKPGYYTYGGTLDYYSQDPFAIFTNLSHPPIRFKFTSHTESLTGDSYFVHDIYRLDYDTYKLFSQNQIANTQTIKNEKGIDLTNRFTNEPPLQQEIKTFNNENKLKFGNNEIPVPSIFFGNDLLQKDKNIIQTYFNEPIITLTASTSAITGTIYDLIIDEFIKQSGKYKTEFFIDKAQYFVNTKIVFNINLGKKYTDFYSIPITYITTGTTITGETVLNSRTTAITTTLVYTKNEEQNIEKKVFKKAWSDSLKIEATNNSTHKIKAGPFSGIDVRGNYFTYFIVPDKPVMEYPIMEGQLTTFTPEFRWSNGDKADSFLVQINYNTGDTGFTGSSVINYPVEKSEKNAKVVRNKIKDSTTETETDKTIYNFQLPIKSNKNFIWRIGNSSELIDIFNVRRNVVTFSDYYMATTQIEPVKTYVLTESDSPYVETIAGLGVPPSLDYESAIEEFTLSGIIRGSTVTGATVQLTYPNSAYTISMTDSGGTYSFSGLETGMYILTTNYRGYQEDIRFINIISDTTENFKLKLLWSNDVDTWGKMSGESYYT